MSTIEKSIFLIRGLPGSGKSTLAKNLSENGKYPVFSVDDYFTDPKSGTYKFEFEKNHFAYKSCEEKTRKAMQDGMVKVFVANTFTMDWEIEPYLKLAEEFNYLIFVVTVEKYHSGVNHHAVSDEQIRKMAEKYKVRLH